MIFNPYTKEAYDFEMIDLCRNLEIHPKVKEMYENFMFMLGMLKQNLNIIFISAKELLQDIIIF